MAEIHNGVRICAQPGGWRAQNATTRGAFRSISGVSKKRYRGGIAVNEAASADWSNLSIAEES